MSGSLRGRLRLLSLALAGALVAGVAVLSAPGTPAMAAAPADITVFGGPSAGDFGALGAAVGGPRPGPGGLTVEARPVNGWGFRPGMGAWMTTATSSGRLVIPGFPTTWNPLVRTGNTMSVSVLDPGAATATTLDVTQAASSSPCYPQAARPDGTCPAPAERTAPVGGADVSDVCRVDTPAGERVVAISAAGSTTVGSTGARQAFPSMVLIDASGATPTYQPVTDIELNNQAQAIGAADGFPVGDIPGFNECDGLPGGGFVVTHYFAKGGRWSGRVSLFTTMDPATPVRLVASLALPNYTVGGNPVFVSPKSVKIDPTPSATTATASTWRIVVTHDVFSAGLDVMPGAFQELAVTLDRVSHTGRVVPRTRPLRFTGDVGPNAQAVSPSDGTLFIGVVQHGPPGDLGSLLSRGVRAYRRNELATGSSTRANGCTTGCPMAQLPDRPALPGSDWTVSDTGDQPVYSKAIHVVGGSATPDNPDRVLVTMNDGRIRPVQWPGWSGTATPFCDVAGAAAQLVTPARDRWDTRVAIGAEKGVVAGDRLYVPLFAHAAGAVNAMRTTAQYRTDRQWLESVDVAAAFRQRRTADAVAGVGAGNGCSVRVNVNVTIDGDDAARQLPLKVTVTGDGDNPLVLDEAAVAGSPYSASVLVPVPATGAATYHVAVDDSGHELVSAPVTVTADAGATVADLHVVTGPPSFIPSSLAAFYGDHAVRATWAARSGGPWLTGYTADLLDADGTVIGTRTIGAPAAYPGFTTNLATGVVFEDVDPGPGYRVRVTARNADTTLAPATTEIAVPFHDVTSAAGIVTTFDGTAVNAPHAPVTVMTATAKGPNSATCAALGGVGNASVFTTTCPRLTGTGFNNVRVAAGPNGIPRDAHKVRVHLEGTADAAGTVTLFPTTAESPDPATAARRQALSVPAGAFTADAEVTVGAGGLVSVASSTGVDLTMTVTAVVDTGLT